MFSLNSQKKIALNNVIVSTEVLLTSTSVVQLICFYTERDNIYLTFPKCLVLIMTATK